MAIHAEKCSCHIRGHIREQVSAFFGPAEDFPYWKYVVLAGVKQRTHQAELVGKIQFWSLVQTLVETSQFFGRK